MNGVVLEGTLSDRWRATIDATSVPIGEPGKLRISRKPLLTGRRDDESSPGTRRRLNKDLCQQTVGLRQSDRRRGKRWLRNSRPHGSRRDWRLSNWHGACQLCIPPGRHSRFSRPTSNKGFGTLFANRCGRVTGTVCGRCQRDIFGSKVNVMERRVLLC